ncbi:hypothetical protein ACWDUD_25265 [Rhodococcus sp. NPDC003382]|uniref:hypothetical protein n=1 Tax=unclassified Rhodococcus (in: high G+C Gram-positive bacteria) TaxID=192944 RepID=UPI0018CE8837|nr:MULTISPECIES: hypothetical protein [unclassified Rhodococcus (in: high G+C Gram-positive bacteria)]MBH0118032.1 hypothetical protein [Rhodococcus sp. CX]MCK8674935.1 hypothetical protein [Rhodococcus sp. HM1]
MNDEKQETHVKRALSALDKIQDRLENELDSRPPVSEKDAGYRSGISEALVCVMEMRRSLTN